jgi:hypothetical protein
MSLKNEIQKLRAANEALEERNAQLVSRIEQLHINFTRVSDELETLNSRPDPMKGFLAALVGPAEMFHKSPDGGERYPGQYRRQGAARAHTAVAQAIINALGIEAGLQLYMPFQAMATALADAKIGKQNPLTDRKLFWNDGLGSARKGKDQQFDDALYVFTVEIAIAVADFSQYMAPPTRDGTTQYRANVTVEKSQDGFQPNTIKQMQTLLGPHYAKVGLGDKILDGNRALESIGTVMRVLGIKEEEAVAFWDRVSNLRKNKNKWPDPQMKAYEFLKKIEEFYVQIELKNITMSMDVEECALMAAKLKVYEDLLYQLKAMGGWGGDRGARLSNLSQCKSGLGRDLLEFKKLSDAVNRKHTAVDDAAYGRVRALLVGAHVSNLPGGIRPEGVMTGEILDETPCSMWWKIDPVDEVLMDEIDDIGTQHKHDKLKIDEGFAAEVQALIDARKAKND